MCYIDEVGYPVMPRTRMYRFYRYDWTAIDEATNTLTASYTGFQDTTLSSRHKTLLVNGFTQSMRASDEVRLHSNGVHDPSKESDLGYHSTRRSYLSRASTSLSRQPKNELCALAITSD